MSDYVAIAGGGTPLALDKNTYLLRADGSVQRPRANFLKELVWSKFAGAPLEILPGDIVVVPTEESSEPPLARISAVTTAVFQSITSIAALFSLAK